MIPLGKPYPGVIEPNPKMYSDILPLFCVPRIQACTYCFTCCFLIELGHKHALTDARLERDAVMFTPLNLSLLKHVLPVRASLFRGLLILPHWPHLRLYLSLASHNYFSFLSFKLVVWTDLDAPPCLADFPQLCSHLCD